MSSKSLPSEFLPLAFKYFGFSCLLFLAVLFLKYLAIESTQNFTSDEAVLNMLGREIYQHGSVFPRNWITANGDLMLPSGTLIIAALLNFFPNNFEMHAFVSILLTAVFLFSIHYALRTYARQSYFLPMAIFASGVSFKYTQMVLLQTTYFWWITAFFLTISVFANHRFSRPGFGAQILVALMSACVSLSNPGRAMLMYVLPALAFVSVFHFPERISVVSLKPIVWRICPITSGWLIAAAIYYISRRLGWWDTVDHASALQLAGPNQIFSNLAILLNGWMNYLGVDALAFGGTVLSGFYLAMCAAFVVLFSAAAIVWWLCAGSRDTGHFDFYRAMAAAFLAAFVPVLVLYVFFVPLAVNEWTTRYFTTPITILFFVSAICIQNWISVKCSYHIVVTVMVLVSICWLSHIRYQVQSANYRAETNLIRVARDIQALNIAKGYSTYWNASSLTVLTSETVKVRPLNVAVDALHPYPVMVSRDWYKDESVQSFLLLTNAEETTLAQVIENQFGRPQRTLSSNGYIILIYDYDLARNMQWS
ncbi:hypothetical protein [Diaphorobacter aerolatus]|uniref:Glycosyltransferase family 39 protein n=1 Tax=Diaphorobacter aerolatus TaxID=1288495 RepID=A0A7H0GNK3_9BURK|nr:hypothetical protein [Diaphorobacter aerolatus]QNP49869.1 hypothetical protein H9K75_08285 [Diaphorobacter aerolatus]